MEKKKETNATLKKRIEKAILHIEKTKDTQSIFFSDKGLRLTVTEDYAIIGTNFHRHVFDKVTSSGYSTPYLYTLRVIDIALENDCKTEGGYSFEKLKEVTKGKNGNIEHNIVNYYDMYISSIFDPLYSIGDSKEDTFLVYENFMHIIAKNTYILECGNVTQEGNDVNAQMFVDGICDKLKDFTKDVGSMTVFNGKKNDVTSDSEEVKALRENELDQITKNDGDGIEGQG